MKLTVITINYNNLVGLKRTFETVFNQTNQDFEYIVIDGDSNDGSLQEILAHKDKISYFRSESDKGVYDAMNKGIIAANGDYCIFMNSGDCFYSADLVDRILPILDGTDIIYGNTHYSNGKIRYSKNEPDLFAFFFVSCWCHQSTFIKTELLKKYLYDSSLRIVADWKFLLQTVIKDNCSYKAIDVDVSLYDATGISSTNKELYEQERELVLSDLFSERYIRDYQRLVYGGTWDEKLYTEMKHSKYHGLFYTLNVLVIRFLCLLKKDSTWIDKYPTKL